MTRRDISVDAEERGYGPVILRRKVECVGTSFLSYHQSLQGISDDELDQNNFEEEEKSNLNSIFDEEDVNYLRRLDPKNWKSQDHYTVLGLGRARHKATQDDIKKAYRLKALKHHPDKRGHETISPDHDYFTCIIKAWEILGNPKTRRSYDSVDQKIDDRIPPNNEISKKHFFTVFDTAFERNSRWSKLKNVPKLGTETSTREHVDQFYSFWYNFQSWREFTYNGSEDDDYEKHVKEEKKMKKQEQMRIRKLVDLAYQLDPRIALFKREEKERKQALKTARKDLIRARHEENERIEKEREEISRKAKEEEQAQKKAKETAQKAERNAQKRALKESRKAFCKIVKENKYYAERPDEAINHMIGLDAICQAFSAQKLQELTVMLETNGRQTYITAVQEATKQDKDKQEKVSVVPPPRSPTPPEKVPENLPPWSRSQLQLLIKATNIFPVGTQKRWEVIADFINQLHPEVQRSYKEVSAKAKELKSGDPQKNADLFNNIESVNRTKDINPRKDVCADPTQRDVIHETERKKSSVQSWVEQTMKTVLSFTQGVVGGNVVESGDSSNKKDGLKTNDGVNKRCGDGKREKLDKVKHKENVDKVKLVGNDETLKKTGKHDRVKKEENTEKLRKTAKSEHVKGAVKVENITKTEKSGKVNKPEKVPHANNNKRDRSRSVMKADKHHKTKKTENIDSVKIEAKAAKLEEKHKKKKDRKSEKPLEKHDTNPRVEQEKEDTIVKPGQIAEQDKVEKLEKVASVNVLFKCDRYNIVDALDSVVDVVFNVSEEKVDSAEQVERVVAAVGSAKQIETVNKTEEGNMMERKVNIDDKLNNADKVDIANKINSHKLEAQENRSKVHHGDMLETNSKLIMNVDKHKVNNPDVEKKAYWDLDENLPWIDEEQQRLERALKLYPSGTPKRWDKIADVVETRDKAECMRRCIELVAMVKAKRAQQNSDGDRDKNRLEVKQSSSTQSRF